MFIWIRRQEYVELIQRLAHCEKELEASRERARRRAAAQNTMLTKIIPTICGVAVAFATVQAVFIH